MSNSGNDFLLAVLGGGIGGAVIHKLATDPSHHKELQKAFEQGWHQGRHYERQQLFGKFQELQAQLERKDAENRRLQNIVENLALTNEHHAKVLGNTRVQLTAPLLPPDSDSLNGNGSK